VSEVLWGIDPTVKRAWTPAEFRIVPAGWAERVKSISPEDEAFKEADVREKFAEDLKEIQREFAGAPRGIKDGAPVVWLSPLPEALSQELQLAKSLYQRLLYWARENLKADCDKVQASDLPEAEKASTIERMEREATLANVARGNAAYPGALRSKVLAACIVGWDRVKLPFSGKWEEDARVLPAEAKESIFLDLVDGSAWTETEVDGFTFGQASPRG
jgi:hypothetical protein